MPQCAIGCLHSELCRVRRRGVPPVLWLESAEPQILPGPSAGPCTEAPGPTLSQDAILLYGRLPSATQKPKTSRGRCTAGSGTQPKPQQRAGRPLAVGWDYEILIIFHWKSQGLVLGETLEQVVSAVLGV